MSLKWVIAIALLLFVPPLFPIYFIYLLLTSRGTAARVIPTLVLEEFKFDESATGPNGVVLEMVGRQPGIINRIMHSLGLATTSHIRVTNREVKITLSRLTGIHHFVAPLGDITASDMRLEKAAWAFWLGLVLVVGILLYLLVPGLIVAALPFLYSYSYSFSAGIVVSPTPIIITAVIAGLLFFGYWKSRRLVVAFSTSELGNRYGLAFNPKSKLTYETLLSCIHYVNNTIVTAHDNKE